jgi:hypothetical protein
LEEIDCVHYGQEEATSSQSAVINCWLVVFDVPTFK